MITKNKIALMIVVIVLPIVFGWVWLSIVIIVFIVTYRATSYIISLIPYFLLRKIITGFCFFFFLLSITISLKLLVFDIYKIPSSSMENLLYPGDVIVVNKLKYGPKLPASPFEIPWVNLFFYMNKKARARINETWWDYRRLEGSVKIRQGDVFVFSFDNSADFYIVKRCVALPGDQIQIKKAEVYVNSILFNSPSTVKNNCSFSIRDQKHLNKIVDSMHLKQYINYGYHQYNQASAFLSKKEFELLYKRKCIDSVKKILDTYGNSQEEILKTTNSKWTLDEMGPIIVPKKGMQIALNDDNFMLYEKVIKLFEKENVTKKNGDYCINGKSAKNYTFKLNYFFMMGDNRKGTSDSRSWGFLPENHIIGKVQCVLFSNRDNEFHGDRLLKML